MPRLPLNTYFIPAAGPGAAVEIVPARPVSQRLLVAVLAGPVFLSPSPGELLNRGENVVTPAWDAFLLLAGAGAVSFLLGPEQGLWAMAVTPSTALSVLQAEPVDDLADELREHEGG